MRLKAYLINLFFPIFLLFTNQCRAMHIPVALLFEQKQEYPVRDDSHPVDPIVAELAIHIDQKYAPILASRQLVHSLLRHHQQSIEAAHTQTTKLGKLLEHLSNYTHAHTGATMPEFIHYYQVKAASTSLAQTESQPILFNEIQQLITNHPHLITHLFISGLAFQEWQVYQVLRKKNRAQTPPLYLLMPPDTDLTTRMKLRDDTRNFLNIPYKNLITLVRDESPEAQVADYQQLSARLIGTTLKKLRAHIEGTHSQSKFIITLGGHGRYSRSQYGVLTDRTKPVDFKALPTIDQSTSGAKDTAGSIAGLIIPEFKNLLNQLSTKVPTALFYYDSCFTGNNHLVLPFTKQDGSSLLLNCTVATPCVDSGVTSHDFFQIGIDPSDPVHMQIVCPMDPKRFFERCRAWCALPESKQHNHILKSAFLAMIGNRKKNNVMLREQGSSHFKPLVARRNLSITPESIIAATQPIILKRKNGQLFLGYNKIDLPIKGALPIIRSIIPTNGTHYIKEIECTYPEKRSIVDILSYMFFHQHNLQAVNRMIFFIKVIKLVTQGTTHTLHDLLVIHHTHSTTQKNSFVIWRNHRKKRNYKNTYSFARPRPSQGLTDDDLESLTAADAHETTLYYLGLDTVEQSYIDAPPLKIALPQAYDDTEIRKFCTQSYKGNQFDRKAIIKIWKLLGY